MGERGVLVDGMVGVVGVREVAARRFSEHNEDGGGRSDLREDEVKHPHLSLIQKNNKMMIINNNK